MAGSHGDSGEGWLVLSDLAEHLRLRVAGRQDVPPRHPRAADETDPLQAARTAEVTSLWRLAAR